MKRFYDALPPSIRAAARVVIGLWSRRKWSDLAAAMLALVSNDAAANMLADRAAGDPGSAIALTSERLRTYGYYARLGEILRRLDISLALDCGAHVGYFGSQMCGYVGFRRDLISFEPVARFHSALEATASAYPRWRAVHAAVGETDGADVIHVGMGHGGTSSLLYATSALATYAPDAVLAEDETIRVVRLDTFLSENMPSAELGSGQIFLKLDVQGSEASALRSLGEYFDRVALIQIELSGIEFYLGQTGFGDLSKLICDKGFSPILAHNNFGADNMVFFDFDFLFCRNELVHRISSG